MSWQKEKAKRFEAVVDAYKDLKTENQILLQEISNLAVGLVDGNINQVYSFDTKLKITAANALTRALNRPRKPTPSLWY